MPRNGCSILDVRRVTATAVALALIAVHWVNASSAQAPPPVAVDLRVNGAIFLLGTDDPMPEFSWRLDPGGAGTAQRAYQLRVAREVAALDADAEPLWDSGLVETARPVARYAGPPLEPRTRYYWTVRVWSDAVMEPDVAESWFETAMMQESDWTAEWIAGPERDMMRRTPADGLTDDALVRGAGEFCRPVGWPESGFFPDAVPNPEGECRPVRPVPMFRRSFEVSKSVTQARLYAVGLGYGAFKLNGEPVSNAVLDPGFTDYSETVLYATHDVTHLVKDGENIIAAMLGSGQFDSSTRTWDWGWDLAEWRASPRMRAELHLIYHDGSGEVIRSDESWSVSTDGPHRYDSYYLGETYDARREMTGWDMPGFRSAPWERVRRVDGPAGILRAQMQEPMRIVRTLPPGDRSEPAPGIIVYDVGQNLAGWVRIRVDAPEGTPIEIFYSEKRDSVGLVLNDPAYALVGGRLQTDYYIARGTGAERWTPQFTYKGFRFVQLSGPNASPLPAGVHVEIEAVDQIRTDLRPTSTFRTSDPLLNRIHDNTRWAVESNLHSVITDTPIYEKNPWTGDAQLSAGVIATLFDSRRFYRKLIQDMLDAQTEDGEVPLLAPSNENYGYVGKPAFKPEDCCGATPAWDAFWFIVPWEAFWRYGDERSLARAFPAMQQYLDHWIPRWTARDGDEFAYTLTSGLGDWDPPEGTPTNISLSSTAYYAHLARVASWTASALGRPDDAARYDTLFARIRQDFNGRFLSPEGSYRDAPGDPFTHTAQILPLAFDLAPDSLRPELAARLADDIIQRGDRAFVGILGARYLLPVLSREGYGDLAFRIATQTEYPSWGYWIETLGWTSLGEHWEANTRSRNHHFFGTIVQWMYENLAGIRISGPGAASVSFEPVLPEGLAFVEASYESVQGTIRSRWDRTNDGVTLQITIPPNVRGQVVLPGSNRHTLVIDSVANGTRVPLERTVTREGGLLMLETGPGSYIVRLADIP